MGAAQAFINTTDLFKRSDENSGELNITQDPGIDTLISRYILMSKKIYDEKNDGYMGWMGTGFRSTAAPTGMQGKNQVKQGQNSLTNSLI